MPSSLALTDHLLSPIERPRCPRCRTRMNLTSVTPRQDCSEKRMFECGKCSFMETKLVSDPMRSEEVNRLANNIRPPA